MEPFKNLLNERAASRIASAIHRAYPSLERKAFLSGIRRELEPLELKQRAEFLSRRLDLFLPANPRKSFKILTSALQQSSSDEVGLSGFTVWPLTRYVARHGVDAHFDDAMAALHSMTQVFTAEFDIRPFLQIDERKTLRVLTRWAEDPSAHVRRLVSEGTRPLLPWGERLPRFVQNPDLTWPLLERLRDDPSDYVRKSVANHLNDHSKNHPEWVIEKLRIWKANAIERSSLDRLIRHASRTLVKKGLPGALALHGASEGAVEILTSRVLTPEVDLGGSLEVEVKVRASSTVSCVLIIDHELQLLKANGELSPKVFKGRKVTLEPAETRAIRMKLPIKPVTVRRYYAGEQRWTALVNGVRSEPRIFRLRIAVKPHR